jgi:hypothetical protein
MRGAGRERPRRTLPIDHVHDTAFDRSGDELLDGLCVRLDPWGSHLLSIQLAVLEPDRPEEP